MHISVMESEQTRGDFAKDAARAGIALLAQLRSSLANYVSEGTHGATSKL